MTNTNILKLVFVVLGWHDVDEYEGPWSVHPSVLGLFHSREAAERVREKCFNAWIETSFLSL